MTGREAGRRKSWRKGRQDMERRHRRQEGGGKLGKESVEDEKRNEEE